MKITNIILIILLLFVAGWIVFKITPATDISKSFYNKIDSLNHNIDSLEKSNKALDSAIWYYNQQIAQIDSTINMIKNEKTTIKEIYHEKITSIDGYTDVQLDTFFAKRYYP